mgnify:CR=1 FL=1
MSIAKDSYHSVKEIFRDEQVINKSRFITTLVPIKDYDDAICNAKIIAKEYSDATHNCYAFISNTTTTEQRFSDDGEPQGTAGIPILEVLKKRNCCMTLAVVTRYFGGIKLGASGLVGAYSSSVSKALDKALLVDNVWASKGEIVCDYGYYKKVVELVEQYQGELVDTIYDNAVTLVVQLREESVVSFQEKLVDLSLGKSTLKIKNKGYFQFQL